MKLDHVSGKYLLFLLALIVPFFLYIGGKNTLAIGLLISLLVIFLTAGLYNNWARSPARYL